ncbi:MAG: DciA family protein [Alphaproteobacteria bacterium]|nr:DciA family protein [Alphaproteobacteria bacterium]
MRFVGPGSFRQVQQCARSLVERLRPPSDLEWLALMQAEWPNIVGSSLAEQTVPDKLWFKIPERSAAGQLTVRVASQGAALIMQHETLFMRDAINQYYNQKIIQNVRVVARR